MTESSIERAQARQQAATGTADAIPEAETTTVAPSGNASSLTLSITDLPDVERCKDNVQREISEEFRALKRAVLGNTFDEDRTRPDNLIMITSITQKAGKSFTALQLGRSLSLEPNKHALLVDADVFQSTLSRQFSPHPEMGLGDYLLNQDVRVQDVIHSTSVDRLRILPMGKSNSMMNELLNSDRMALLLDEFKSRYKDRLVIFDAPPLLRSNVAMTLAEKMDQIIILIEPGVTRTADLKSVKEHLPKEVDVRYVINKSLDTNNWAKDPSQNKG